MSEGAGSSAITEHAPASSAILAWSALVTSMITPPLSISARPTFTRHRLLFISSMLALPHTASFTNLDFTERQLLPRLSQNAQGRFRRNGRGLAPANPQRCCESRRRRTCCGPFYRLHELR